MNERQTNELVVNLIRELPATGIVRLSLKNGGSVEGVILKSTVKAHLDGVAYTHSSGMVKLGMLNKRSLEVDLATVAGFEILTSKESLEEYAAMGVINLVRD